MRLLKNRRLKELQWRAVGVGGKWLIDLLFHTSRIEVTGFEAVRELMASRRFILAFWHGRLLMLSYVHKGFGAAILVSRSDDGEMIARVVHKQGHVTVRGSSSKGGLPALARLIKTLTRENRPGVVVPDGPQGPRYVVQPGVILMAKRTGYPIIPLTCSSRRMKVFASWDRFILPRPGSDGRVAYGTPLYVPPDADGETLRACRRRLEAELNRITVETDAYFGHRTP